MLMNDVTFLSKIHHDNSFFETKNCKFVVSQFHS